LVCAVGVEGEGAQNFAGRGVDDADVEVFGEADDAGSCVGSSHHQDFAAVLSSRFGL
jgi:hypothetical protein